MRSKIASYSAEILSLRIQRYTLSMIQLWLMEKYQVKASMATIARSYKRSLAANLEHSRSVSGSDYARHKKEVTLRLQYRSYSRNLDRYMGVIQYYYFQSQLKPREILVELQSQGIETSLSSVYRIIRVMREQKSQAKLYKGAENICKRSQSSKGTKQSDVQLRAYLRSGNFPQL